MAATQQDILIQIAEAMANELNEAQTADPPVFAQPFTAERVYDYTRNLEDTNTLRVDVVPEYHTDELFTRSAWKGTGVVSIVVRKKIAPENIEDVDALTYLVGQLRDFWTAPLRRLALFPGATPIKRKIVFPYLPEKLRSKGQFVSMLQLTFNLVSQ